MNMLLKSKKYRVPQKKINDFAIVSGGEAKIHTDPEYAKQTIFKGTLVHGMFLLALIEFELEKHFSNWKGATDVKFIKPIKEGQVFNIELKQITEEELKVLITTDDNQIAVSGIARIRNM